MGFIYLGLYTLMLVFVWGFFIVAKLHTYKFKNFSVYIAPVTSFLLIFLVVLSILGYITLFFSFFDKPGSASLINSSDKVIESKDDFNNLDFNEINY